MSVTEPEQPADGEEIEEFKGRATHGIIFPVYSRFHQKGSEMLPIYRNARLPLLVIGGWATAGIVAGGPTIIELLYDPRYI